MAKKRPRQIRRLKASLNRVQSKMEPAYWRSRLFRNSFTYKGSRHEVRHWSVKIQHEGARRTFSLSAINRRQATVEACDLYKAIIKGGWEGIMAERGGKGAAVRTVLDANGKNNGSDVAYWAQRLIHRKYGEIFRPNAEREFSVRVEHAGTSYYFPLGTDSQRVAAKNAARIHRVVKAQGWDNACSRFARELSIAFRWSDNPLAWTYTTVFTEIASEQKVIENAAARAAKFRIGIVGSDPGLCQALQWCINQQDGCDCVATFDNASAALMAARRNSFDLLLVSQNLADRPGIECLNELNSFAPRIFGLLFSVFEDSELLFKAAPGGAPCYVFRRTPATRILIPIEAALKAGNCRREHFNKSIRRYFEDVVNSSPIHGSADELSNLTPREHEILGLLSKGHPDKEIADSLRISTWTVHGHLKKIFEKLGAHNRTDAVVKYLNK